MKRILLLLLLIASPVYAETKDSINVSDIDKRIEVLTQTQKDLDAEYRKLDERLGVIKQQYAAAGGSIITLNEIKTKK